MSAHIVSVQFSHESNTFSRAVTDMAAFRRRIFVEDGDVRVRYAGTSTELGAHLEAASRYGWTLHQPFAAHATPSGPVSRDMLDYAVERLVRAAKGADGALLALHGAMVAHGVHDAEGYLLRRIRDELGPHKPIVITLDTHANVTDEMARHVNGMFIYRTYPHVDQYDLAHEAAALLQHMLTTGERYQVHTFRLPMLDGCDHGRTHGSGPMPHLLAQAASLKEVCPELREIAVSVGFPWSDILQAGPALSVTTQAPRDVTLSRVQPLLEQMWHTRRQRSIDLLDLDAVVREIGLTPPGEKPIVVADFSDNPGHGAPGDGVSLLRALHEAGIQNVAVACVCDPQAVAQCVAAGQGARLQLSFGARAMPELYGDPFTAVCTVEHLGDGSLVYAGPMRRGTRISLGPTATISIGGITVVLATNNIQVQDLNFFRANGIEPTEKSVVVVKSQQHFRAAFQPIARRVLVADSGGFVSPDLSKLPYREVRRPVWPLDELPDALPHLD